MHIYGVKKHGTDEFICRAAMEKQTERTDLLTGQGERGESELYGKSKRETYISICKVDSQWEFAV